MKAFAIVVAGLNLFCVFAPPFGLPNILNLVIFAILAYNIHMGRYDEPNS